MGQEEDQKRVWDRDAERERKRLYRERKRAEEEFGIVYRPVVPIELDRVAFPHVQGRDPESSWTLRPTPEKLARLHPKN